MFFLTFVINNKSRNLGIFRDFWIPNDLSISGSGLRNPGIFKIQYRLASLDSTVGYSQMIY